MILPTIHPSILQTIPPSISPTNLSFVHPSIQPLTLPKILPLIINEVFGPTLKHSYTNELFVWLLLCYVCLGNAGPSDILLIQPRLHSGTKHSSICHTQSCTTKYMLSFKAHFSTKDSMKIVTMHPIVFPYC